MQPEKQPSKPPGAYGKRPLWQWIALYVVVAAIVYAIIYLVFFRKSGGSTGGYGY